MSSYPLFLPWLPHINQAPPPKFPHTCTHTQRAQEMRAGGDPVPAGRCPGSWHLPSWPDAVCCFHQSSVCLKWAGHRLGNPLLTVSLVESHLLLRFLSLP